MKVGFKRVVLSLAKYLYITFPIALTVLLVKGVVVRECSSGNLCTAVSMSIRRNVGSMG